MGKIRFYKVAIGLQLLYAWLMIIAGGLYFIDIIIRGIKSFSSLYWDLPFFIISFYFVCILAIGITLVVMSDKSFDYYRQFDVDNQGVIEVDRYATIKLVVFFVLNRAFTSLSIALILYLTIFKLFLTGFLVPIIIYFVLVPLSVVFMVLFIVAILLKAPLQRCSLKPQP